MLSRSHPAAELLPCVGSEASGSSFAKVLPHSAAYYLQGKGAIKGFGWLVVFFVQICCFLGMIYINIHEVEYIESAEVIKISSRIPW